MARRSDHTREDLFALVLDGAQRIVESEGYQSLTARRVAQAVGYSPGTLYNLFANLDALVVHLNARTLGHLGEQLAGVPLTGDPKADLLAQAKAYLEFLERHPRLWDMLFGYRLAAGSALPDWFTARIDQALAHVEAALAPLFGKDDTRKKKEAALVLWASLHGIGQLAADGKLEIVNVRSASQLVESLIIHFVAGLAACR
jgi:AcrR family transcriptional regulator